MPAVIHTVRLARTSLFLLVSATALSLVSGLVYLNQVGFPGSYGEWIRGELDQRGIHLSFETLRYDPRHGIVATQASLFDSADRSRSFLEADEMILDLDKTKALRGTFKLLGLHLTNGTARLPVKDQDRFLKANDIQTSLKITESGVALLRNASALVEGIRLDLSADLQLLQKRDRSTEASDSTSADQIIRSFLDELSRWDLPPDVPPHLTLHLEGDLNQPDRLKTSFQFHATQLGRNQYRLKEIKLAGDLRAEVVTLDHILIEDETGTLSGQADWCLDRRDGRFDLLSTLQPQDLLRDCFNLQVLEEFHPITSPTLAFRGRYALAPDGSLSVKTTGRLGLGTFRYQNTRYDALSCEFSWHDGDLFLRDLEVLYGGKTLHGKALLKDQTLQFDVTSQLPLLAFRPLIEPGSKLEHALSEVSFEPASLLATTLSGNLDLEDRRSWSATGSIRLEDFSYRGTRARHLETKFDLNHHRASFADISLLINDDSEKARRRYRGRASGEISVDRILFDSASKFVTITNLGGKAWPTPVVRIFAPKTAEHLEQNYCFHQPPQVTLNGRFAGRREDLPRSSFSVAVTTTGQTDYPFLGSDLPLENLRADVVVKGTDITVKNLSAQTLGGSLEGSLFCALDENLDNKFRGNIKWDQVSFRELSRVYEFDDEEKGILTGSIDFRGGGDNIRNFNADGIVAVEGGNLVSIPILGPLSPIMAGLLRDKRMGYERAKDASAHFAVRKGILSTKDFVAISTSIILTGEGRIDLLTDRIDMVIRVNARGLLGFLSLPLQPLRGIFQFRGSGNYDAPLWRSAPFTRPPRGENDPIFRKPGRATIIKE